MIPSVQDTHPILGARGMNIVIVEYILGGTMEVYFFNLDDGGNGVVMFSTIRSSTFLNNSPIVSRAMQGNERVNPITTDPAIVTFVYNSQRNLINAN